MSVNLIRDMLETPPTQNSPLMMRHGPLSWWVLVDAFEVSSQIRFAGISPSNNSNSESSRSPCLENLLGMTNGTKMLIEMKNVDGGWPCQNLLEDPDFRLFEVDF